MRPQRLLWATVGVAAMVFALVGAGSAARAQIPIPPPTFERPPTTDAPQPTTAPTLSPARPTPTTAFAPTADDPTATTAAERRGTTTTATTEPPTTTIATIAPPADAASVPDTAPPQRALPGQGEMPAWPLWLFGIGAGGTVSMMAGQYWRTRR